MTKKGSPNHSCRIVGALAAIVAVVFFLHWMSGDTQEPVANTPAVFEFEGQKVFYLNSVPSTKRKGTVLLLHGAAYSSQTWTAKSRPSDEKTGTLEALRNAGFKAVAIDLPGFARSESVKVGSKADFLKDFVEHIGGADVVVAPSASGSFALPFLEKYGPVVKGFVPVAPGTSGFKPSEELREQLKVFAVAGENDKKGMATLDFFKSLFEDYEQLVVENGSHPAYLDTPDLWNTKLIAFAQKVVS